MVSPSIAEDAGNYRLAGTIETRGGAWLAVLELPGGEQKLLASGDSVPGGMVMEIGATWLRLVDKAGELILTLEGDGTYVRRHTADAGFADVEASTQLQRNLENLQQDADDPDQLTRDLNRLLQIPDHGEIVAIDDLPVESSGRALELVLRSLGENHAVRLEVSGVDGFDAVYLTPGKPLPGTRDK